MTSAVLNYLVEGRFRELQLHSVPKELTRHVWVSPGLDGAIGRWTVLKARRPRALVGGAV